MSLRLVASAAGVALTTGGVPDKKAHYGTFQGTSAAQWLLAETNPAEESEEDPTGGAEAPDLPALAALVFAPARTVSAFSPLAPALATGLGQPLFLLFQNFRI